MAQPSKPMGANPPPRTVRESEKMLGAIKQREGDWLSLKVLGVVLLVLLTLGGAVFTLVQVIAWLAS